MSAREPIPEPQATTLLRFTTCGSVDDGKSTLIGRLLYDSKSLLADALNHLERTSANRGFDGLDLSLVTDGLQAEREQGITIDVAYRYFTTGHRKYIIADAPGHEQYTRNMVTAASTADLAIILVDASKGVSPQTRRHTAISALLGIPQVVFAINKMDLVDWSQARYTAISEACGELAARLGIAEAAMLPLSALHGDLVVERGERMPWYAGPTLMDLLERAHGAHPSGNVGLRFPVQWVSRPDGPQGMRRYSGKIEAGEVAVGDEIQVLPAGHPAIVQGINLGNQTLQRAEEGQSVMLALDRELDVSRGDMFVSPDQQPRVLRDFEAELCWLAESPLNIARTYLLRHTTREVRAKIIAIHHTLDIKTLEHTAASELHVNALGRVSLRLAQPVAVDTYTHSRATGAFILIDADTNATVAAGMIR
ncbi:MAG: Bifunctional enzyme CysN/CysC [Rhodocyclaceae bacterium]|nr:50S ribosome-binding GTPase [Rhodocyclaceae bacterium]MCG3186718.1 Bifunctional enzyme CysN/CysC [Rhodocyclaceae bacterium]